MMKNKKEFDAVKMMRDIRKKHHEEYEKNPELREKRLAEIRKIYYSRTSLRTTLNRRSSLDKLST